MLGEDRGIVSLTMDTSLRIWRTAAAIALFLLASAAYAQRKPTLAVFDTIYPDGLDAELMGSADDAVIEAFVSSGEFTVIDREHIAQLLSEREAGPPTEAASSTQAAKTGLFIGADIVVVSELRYLKAATELSMKAIDVDSGAILAQASMSRDSEDVILRDLARSAAERLAADLEDAVQEAADERARLDRPGREGGFAKPFADVSLQTAFFVQALTIPHGDSGFLSFLGSSVPTGMDIRLSAHFPVVAGLFVTASGDILASSSVAFGPYEGWDEWSASFTGFALKAGAGYAFLIRDLRLWAKLDAGFDYERYSAAVVSDSASVYRDATLLGYAGGMEAGIDFRLLGFLDLGFALSYSHSGLVDSADSSAGLDAGRIAGALRLGITY
jgi:hypothetical protein